MGLVFRRVILPDPDGIIHKQVLQVMRFKRVIPGVVREGGQDQLRQSLQMDV